MNGHVSLRIALLDKQILDADELPVGRVDDLELELQPDRPPRVSALLTGAEALGGVLGGLTGRWMAAAAARLRSGSQPPGPAAIPVESIAELEPMIRLSVELRELKHVAGLERWLARNLIEPLPGTGDARE